MIASVDIIIQGTVGNRDFFLKSYLVELESKDTVNVPVLDSFLDKSIDAVHLELQFSEVCRESNTLFVLETTACVINISLDLVDGFLERVCITLDVKDDFICHSVVGVF